MAGVAELVDAHDSKSCDSNVIGVRFPAPAHKTNILIIYI